MIDVRLRELQRRSQDDLAAANLQLTQAAALHLLGAGRELAFQHLHARMDRQVPEVAGVLHVERNRIGAPQLVADVLRRNRRLDPELLEAALDLGLQDLADVDFGDADVAGAPTFRQIAKGLLDFLGEADLAGFNVARFDVPLLDREFRDCGLDLGLDRRRVIDAMTIFHRKEPRHLSAAVRFYLGREHAGAHAAAADVEAAAEVLAAQLARYDDVPCTIEALDGWISPVPVDAVDRHGKKIPPYGETLRYVNGVLERALEAGDGREEDSPR